MVCSGLCLERELMARMAAVLEIWKAEIRRTSTKIMTVGMKERE